MRLWNVLRKLGPTFIVGACIIGPGSVVLMAKTGSMYGYSMLWLSVLSGALMAGFLALFMRYGLYAEETFLGYTRRRLGAAYAVLCGISLCSVDAAFQFGNNLGVTTGMGTLIPSIPEFAWPMLFTSAAIVFLFAFKSIYKLIERMMAAFLIIMMLAFLSNLISARPSIGSAMKGVLVPSIPADVDVLTISGLVATTFVIVAAFFQPYLVKAKGWREDDFRSGVTDTILASVTFTLLGSIIMMTAAAVLHPRGIVVATPEDLISQLEGVFGQAGKVIFCIGFWAAAFSSFVTNSLIGGVLLNDGLGFGGGLESRHTRIFATLVLLVGMCTALFIIGFGPAATPGDADGGTVVQATDAVKAAAGERKLKAIAIGQASTLLAVPLGVVAMLFALLDPRATRGRALPPYAKLFVVLGALFLLFNAGVTYAKIPTIIQTLRG